jgi:hypothetical protein
VADRVDLTELDVITRWSLAVRSATADRQQLIAALTADLAWLEGQGRPVEAAAEPAAGEAGAGEPTSAPRPARARPAKRATKAVTPAKRAAKAATPAKRAAKAAPPADRGGRRGARG